MSRYAYDEDVALRAPNDFAMICPRSQRLVAGNDGTFLPSDRWRLRSATTDFTAGGLAPGHIVQLIGPKAAFRSPGELFAVEAVDAAGVHLRHLGQPAGTGMPPSPETGLNEVEFLVVTLDPQLAIASQDFNERFGIQDKTTEARVAASLVRQLVVLSVLVMRYEELDCLGDRDGAWSSKVRNLATLRDELYWRVAIPQHDPRLAPLSRFITKIVR